MKSCLFLLLLLAPLSSLAGYRQECTFYSENGYPQFKTSIEVVAPKTFGDILTIYSYDSGESIPYVGQSIDPLRGEKFRLQLAPNSSFTSFVLNEMQINDRAQAATLYFPSTEDGTQMSGTCKFVRP